MMRKGLLVALGIVCVLVWLGGVLQFVRGGTLLGGALVLVGALGGVLVMSQWTKRDGEATSEGILRVILDFFSNWP
jgi:hypothetical protein